MLNKPPGKRKVNKRVPDKIWQSRDQAFRDMLAFAAALGQADRVLLVAHFADTLRALEERLSAQKSDFRTYATPFEGHRLGSLAEYQPPGCILLALAQVLPNNLPASSQAAAAGGFQIHVLVAEHHPLPSLDDRVLEFAHSLPGLSQVVFYESLDGAFMRHFGGAKVTQLSDLLKIPEGECISSPLVDRSIRQAQEKVARRVANPLTADSADQWFQQNLPGRQ